MDEPFAGVVICLYFGSWFSCIVMRIQLFMDSLDLVPGSCNANTGPRDVGEHTRDLQERIVGQLRAEKMLYDTQLNSKRPVIVYLGYFEHSQDGCVLSCARHRLVLALLTETGPTPVHFFSHGSTMMLGEESESADYWKKCGDEALARNIKGVIIMVSHSMYHSFTSHLTFVGCALGLHGR